MTVQYGFSCFFVFWLHSSSYHPYYPETYNTVADVARLVHSNMYPPPGRLPLRLAVKTNLDKWLDTLEICMSSSTTDQEPKLCSCCESVLPLDDPFEGAGNSILLLPCGCPWHRGCLKEMFGIEEDNRSKCMNCNLRIFEEWTLSSWIKTLKKVPMSAVSSGEVHPECAICKNQYRLYPANDSGEKPEQPMMLPCKHIMGENCLQKWLSPGGGSGNSCPICRRKLFPPWPSTTPVSPVVPHDIALHGIRQRQEAGDEVAEARRLEERLYWDRFIEGHQQLQHLSSTDAAADREWLDEQLDDMEVDYREWVFEPRWQLAERRGRIRELLLSRVMARARTRSDLLRLEMLEVLD